MPKTTLEYVAEKYKERNNLFMDLKWDKMLEKEEEFVSLCKELASNRAMVLSLPDFLNTKKESLADELVWEIGIYILLLSEDDENLKKLKQRINDQVSLLEQVKQKKYIDKKIEENDAVGMIFVITRNNYTEYIDEIIKNMNEKEDVRKKYNYFKMLSLFKQEEFYPMFLDAFKNQEETSKKESLAYGLLNAPLPPIWEYYQNKISQKKEEEAHEFFYVIASYGSPSDWQYIEKLVENSMDNSEALIMIAYNLGDFGYVGGFELYINMLKHTDDEVRMTYHKLMCNFFYADEAFLKEAEKLEEFDSESLLKFWNSKKEYISKHLDRDVHYWNGEPFDLLKIAEYKGASSVIGALKYAVDSLRLWTGENFAFDNQALFKRQFEQYETIKQWLRDNKDRFPAGRWYRWGVDVTNGYNEK